VRHSDRYPYDRWQADDVRSAFDGADAVRGLPLTNLEQRDAQIAAIGGSERGGSYLMTSVIALHALTVPLIRHGCKMQQVRSAKGRIPHWHQTTVHQQKTRNRRVFQDYYFAPCLD
jgi:hypothetical protein